MLMSLLGCKTAKPVVEKTGTNPPKTLNVDNVVQNHYANKKDFSTAYIKSSVRYKDAKTTQNVTTEIRIKKNEIILVSVRLLGITMAKALITPKEVKYYEKLNGNYFEGDYALLSQFLGTDLDFIKVQNLLIGQALDDLKTGSYNMDVNNNLYKLTSDSNSTTSKEYYFDDFTFQLKKEVISQSAQQRMLQVIYPDFKLYNQITMPSGLTIDAVQKKGKTNIIIDYNSVTFNEELSFPYSVPDGYERIFIN